MSGRTLYANANQTRFFHIPDDVQVAPGPMALRSLTGKRREVDEQAARAYEIPEDRAKALVQEQLTGFAAAAGRVVSGAGQVLRQVAAAQRAGKPSEPAQKTNEQLVADSLGVTAEQLRNDPQAVLAGLQTLAAGLKDMVRDAVREDEQSREETQRRLKLLAEIVGRDVPDAVPTIESIPERLRELLADPALERQVHAATDALRDELDALRKAEQPKPDDELEN